MNFSLCYLILCGGKKDFTSNDIFFLDNTVKDYKKPNTTTQIMVLTSFSIVGHATLFWIKK